MDVELGAACPFDARQLWRHALRIEAQFGCPQDIEWAYDGRRFVILQSRDIVPVPRSAHTVIADEWQRLSDFGRETGRDPAAALPILSLDTMSELLPRPTPASLSLLNAFWASGGSMDVAARELGFAAPAFDGDGPGASPRYVTVFGTLYVDQRQKAQRALQLSLVAARRLRAGALALEADIRSRVLPEIFARAAVQEAIDPRRLDELALMSLFEATRHRLVNETHVSVDKINIAAQMFMDEARAALLPFGSGAGAVLASVPETILRCGLVACSKLPDRDQDLAFIALMGHRAPFDYELANARYGETREGLRAAAEQLMAMSSDVRAAPDTTDRLPKKVREAVERAQRFVTLKEDAKHESLREFAFLRRLIGEIDRRFTLQATASFLTLEEIGSLTIATRDGYLAVASARQAHFEAMKEMDPLPADMCLRDLEVGPLLRRRAATSSGDGALRATRVSGQAPAEGRAICVTREVCESGAPIPGFEAGDIIVARSMHPAWLPHMMEAGGVLVETGGWLSHMAILARERGLAMSVGAKGLDQITTGMRLRLDVDGGVVKL